MEEKIWSEIDYPQRGVVGKAFRREGTEFFSLVTSEEEDGYVLFTFGELGGYRVFRPEEKMSRAALEASLPYWKEVSVGHFRRAKTTQQIGAVFLPLFPATLKGMLRNTTCPLL